MKNYNSFSDLWNDFESDETFLTEKNILEFTTQLYQLMKSHDISKKELADKLGSSQAYVTKIFKGNANFTIATMTKLAIAVGGRLTIHVTGEEEKEVKWYRAIEKNSKKAIVPRWNPPIVESTISSEDCFALGQCA